MSQNKISIAVGVACYNQQDLIEYTIEGILSQQVNADVHLTICDDCSKDETVARISAFEKKYPGKITTIVNSQNIGMVANFRQLCDLLSGTYIAFCAGDDFWHDPLKLQKQIDFLEQNPDHAIVHTDYNCVDMQNNVLLPSVNKASGEKLVQRMLDGEPLITPLTIMYRGSVFEKVKYILKEFEAAKLKIEDLGLYMLILKNYKIGYLRDATASYRLVKNSLSRPETFEKRIEFCMDIIAVYEFLYTKDIIALDMMESKKTQYYKNCLALSSYYHKPEAGYKYYQLLKQKIGFNAKNFLFFLGSRYAIVSHLHKWLFKLRRESMTKYVT